MNYEAFYESFSNTLTSLIPDKRELIDFIAKALRIDKRAVSRRLQGDYQFRVNEVLQICSLLNISVDGMIPQKDSSYSTPFLIYYPFDNLTQKEYTILYKGLEKYKAASKEKGSYVLMSCNILPEILCFQYENLTKFVKFKWYYYKDTVSAKNYMAVEQIPERAHLSIIREYIATIFQFEKILIVWDYNIIPSLINDIDYFAQTGYLNPEHKQLLKKDLFSLIEKIDQLCTHRILPGYDNELTFAVSMISLSKSHSLLKAPDFKIAIDSALYTLYLYITDKQIVESVEHIIWSTLKSSVIISQSNEKERLKFIAKQKELIERI